MKKWIRWPGLIAFIGVLALLFVFFFLFAGKIIKIGIETAGTKAVGAKVELNDVNVSFWPLGLNLSGIQVTNPDEPMQNAIEIMQAKLDLDALNLLRRKAIIEEMTVDGVKFNTARKESGAVEKPIETDEEEKPIEKDQKQWQLPEFGAQDVKEILAREKLLTVEAAQKLQEDIKKEKQALENELKDLPDQAKFEEYEKRIKELKKGGGLKNILKSTDEVKAIKKDFDQDIKKIKDAQKHLKNSVKNLNARVKEVSQYPAKDLERIKSKYTLSPQGMGNLTQLIFGPQYAKWVENGLAWYQIIAPYLQSAGSGASTEKEPEPERGKGVNVRFKEYQPLPDFLIRHTSVSLNLEAGDISGTIENITNDQATLGKPTTYDFSGKELKSADAITLSGELNHLTPENAKDTLKVELKGQQVKDLTLSESKSLPVTLQSASSDVNLDALVNGKKLNSKAVVALNTVKFQKPEEKGSGLSNSIHAALNDVTKFSITANVQGTVDSQKIQLSSDLDQVMKNAVSKTVQKQTAAFETKLKGAINAKTQPHLAPLQKSLGEFNGIDQELTNRLKIGDQLSEKLFF